MSLEQELAAYFKSYNAAPRASFSGLSSEQMHLLIYNTLSGNSPVQLRANLPDAVLDQVPLLCLTEAFLRVVQRDGGIKLTASGALPRKYLVELYGLGLLPEEFIESGLVRLNREQDSVVLSALHVNTTLAGLVKKIHGRLTLTKKGTQLLATEKRRELLELTLFTFTEKFNWAYFDLYPSETVGQMAWAYSVYLLRTFGDESRPAVFYAEKYRQAFPFVRNDFPDKPYSTPEAQLASCYCIRVFGRSLNWFGLLSMRHQQRYLDADATEVAPSPLLTQLFDVWQALKRPIL
jgi:hypothetical protein